jgi:hypothetical protein
MTNELAPAANPSAAAERSVRMLAIGALILALAYLAWRGVWRAIGDSEDLAVGYAAARAWWLGLDPYAVGALKTVLLAADGGSLATGDLLDGLRNVYLPPTLPVFLPLALGSWPIAWPLMLGLNLGASLAIAVGLVRLLGWPLSAIRSLWLCAGILALGPLHLTMALGQTAILASALLVGAILLERASRPRSAGVLYGLATAVKIQIGLPFVAYLVWRRRWASVAWAGLVLAGLTGLSVGRMALAGVPWYDSWMANLALLSGPGGINDPSRLNPERYSLINLQYPLGSIVGSAELANLLTLAAVGAAAALTVWLIRGRRPRHELLAISIVAVLGLLVTYHRYYDAVLLAIPIAWAFSVLGTARWRQGAIVLVLSLDFVVPAQTTLHDLQQRGLVPAALIDTAFWEIVVLAQQAWTLVLVTMVLLWAAMRYASASDTR